MVMLWDASGHDYMHVHNYMHVDTQVHAHLLALIVV